MEDKKPEAYELLEGDRLFLRRSKSGKGIYISNEHLRFGMRGNMEHVRAVINNQKDFAVVEVRTKEIPKE